MKSMRNIAAVLSAFVMALAVTAGAAFAGDTLTLDSVSEKNIDMPAQDELLMTFMEKHASAEAKMSGTVKSSSRGSRLTGNDAAVYKVVRAAAEKIASGDLASSEIQIPIKEFTNGKLSFTASDLNVSDIYLNDEFTPEAEAALNELTSFDEDKVLDALLADCPYEFYWFDKTRGFDAEGPGISLNFNGTEWSIDFDDDSAWVISFYVSRDYSETGSAGTTDVDTIKTSSASAAADTAGEIVKKYAVDSDLAKLTAYKNEICGLTSYNDAAASGSVEFGDPWQLIYVFDGNNKTNVVCEGYSKAFQFLCDLTSFKSSHIWSMLVSGAMTGGTGAGEHMWNIVHMNDGKNYLADITNSDTDTIGDPEGCIILLPLVCPVDILNISVTLKALSYGEELGHILKLLIQKISQFQFIYMKHMARINSSVRTYTDHHLSCSTS